MDATGDDSNALWGGVDNINEVFEQARDTFFESLSEQDRLLYSPCASPDDLVQGFTKLVNIAGRKSRSKKWIETISRFTDRLKPYFAVVNVFVSSNPEYAGLVWGALRLVFQLANNLATFFDKLIQLLSRLADSFPQYDFLLRLCKSADDGDCLSVTDRLQNLRSPGSRIRQHIAEVYCDLFQIIHSAIRVFTKSNGTLKRSPFVLGDVMWKPFDHRFSDTVTRMEERRRAIFDEVLLCTADALFKEQVRAAADRQISSQERAFSRLERDEAEKAREQAKEERRLMSEERRLMSEERHRNSQDQHYIKELLRDIRRKLCSLEENYAKNAYKEIRRNLSLSNYHAVLDKVSSLRQQGTASWILQEPFYRRWLERQPEAPASSKFGSRAMWIYGHPGCGKTTLASSIIESLESADVGSETARHDVFYYFFDYSSPGNRSSKAAYHAILAQMITKRRADQCLLDTFAFLQDYCDGGDFRTESALLDLVELNLREQSIFVLDGIDECTDPEQVLLIDSLAGICRRVPSLRVVFFSRVNVTPLKRMIRTDMQHELTKSSFSRDIRCFYDSQLEKLFDQELLPESYRGESEAMIQRLVRGADGMFLWARLMINFLESSFLTPMHRVKAIQQVNSPEGLDSMFDRILSLIISSGQTSSTIASRVLIWLIYSTFPMSSKEIRQALIVDGCLPREMSSEDIFVFEETAIMACAGLVQRHILVDSTQGAAGIPALRLIHLSAWEMLKTFSRPSPSWTRPISHQAANFLPPPGSANLYVADSCLKQLLYHTPAQPLSGKMNERVSEKCFVDNFRFTAHAAVCWLVYIDESTRYINDFVPTHHLRQAGHTGLFDECLPAIVESISLFLGKPAVVSVWLESFYTVRAYMRNPTYCHPPAHLLSHWAASVRARTQQIGPVNDDLHRNIQDFENDIKSMSDIWGDQLAKAPEIIWDELTGFVESRLVFNPGSTQATFQDPQPLARSGLPLNLIAAMSRTSHKGDIKGTLRIWGPRAFQDMSHINAIRSSEEANLHRICSDWVAEYEVLDLRQRTTRVGGFQLDIDPEDVLLPVRRCIDRTVTTSIDLPMAISPDALACSFLRTLVVINPRRQNDAAIMRHNLPIRRDQAGFSWRKGAKIPPRPYLYNVHFGQPGKYVAVEERDETGRQLLVMLRYDEDRPTIDRIGKLDMGELESCSHVTFHPNVAIMAFHATHSCLYGVQFQQTIVFWLFGCDSSNVSIHKLNTYLSPTKLQFASCGSFLIVDPGPIVLPVPQAMLNDPAARIPSKTGMVSGSSPASSLVPSRDSQSTSALEASSSTLVHGSSIRSDTDSGPVSVSVSRGAVRLSLLTDTTKETMKLAALPASLDYEDTTQVVIMPRAPGDSLKISIDKQAKTSYPVSRPAAANGSAAGLVIERDPRFLVPPPSLHFITQGPRERGTPMNATIMPTQKRQALSMDPDTELEPEGKIQRISK